MKAVGHHFVVILMMQNLFFNLFKSAKSDLKMRKLMCTLTSYCRSFVEDDERTCLSYLHVLKLSNRQDLSNTIR